MKQFDDLTDQEIYDLTDEQLDYYKKIACAEAGAPIAVPPLPDRPEEPQVTPDATAYRVKIGYSDTLIFATMDEAQTVVNAINSGLRRNLNYFAGTKYRYITTASTDKLEIESFPVFSEAEYKRIEKETEAWALKQKEYDEAVSIRSKASKARSSALEWVNERIEQARENVIERMRHESAFAEYLELANQDAEVAYRFFLKAYGYPSEPMQKYLLTTHGFQVPAQEQEAEPAEAEAS